MVRHAEAPLKTFRSDSDSLLQNDLYHLFSFLLSPHSPLHFHICAVRCAEIGVGMLGPELPYRA